MLARKLFTVHEYHRMGEAGILHEDDRVELIEGEIVEMSPVGGRHVSCVGRLTRIISRVAGERYLVNVQSPIRLSDHWEPQPDLAVVRDRDYGDTLPGPEDILFLIEVADTSLAHDKNVKLPFYARSGIPEVWIVDLTTDTIERHMEPSGSDYRLTEKVRQGDTFESTALTGLSLRADAVFG
ncbi:Uma2 family endonuclease [soil metagenome]